MRPRLLAAGLLAIALLWPGTAQAHLVTTGLGPVYDGISHLFLTLDDLLPVVAMALLAGLNGATAGRRALFVLPAAWLAGGVAGYVVNVALLPAWTTSLSLLVLGILTAIGPKIAARIVGALAAILGIVHGWLNGAAIAAAALDGSGLVGIAGAIFVTATLVAALVVALRPPWTRIAVRVAGSWIAAIGLLLLGWALRGRV